LSSGKLVTFETAPKMSKPIIVVYHLYQAAGWEQLFLEQIGCLFASGLFPRASVHVGVDGKDLLPEIPGITFVRHQKRSYEKYSLLMLKDLAQENPTARMLYIHGKGISHPTKNQDDWRMMMQHFLIVNWRLCTELLDNNDVVAANWRTFQKPHASGNFWWANASFINQLDARYLKDKDKMTNEFWIGSIPAKVANLHETELNHYLVPSPPSIYCKSFFDQYQASGYELSYSSRAEAIAQGLIKSVKTVDHG